MKLLVTGGAGYIGSIVSGRLIRLLERWCPPQPGYFLYYTRAGRRQPPALAAFIAALRARRAAPR